MATQLVKLMHGFRPEELPIEQRNVFELITNLNTANALGGHPVAFTISRADQVIK
jgi:hypothetical protein